jgi:hypothetical protein
MANTVVHSEEYTFSRSIHNAVEQGAAHGSCQNPTGAGAMKSTRPEISIVYALAVRIYR